MLVAVLALAMLAVMRSMQIRWTRTWVEKGGRARAQPVAAAAARLAGARRVG